MADGKSIGAITVDLLLNTNAPNVLSKVGTGAKAAGDATSVLQGQTQQLTLSLNESNIALVKGAQSSQQTVAANRMLGSVMSFVKDTAEKTITTYVQTDNAGKQFSTTINRMKFELEGAANVLGQGTQANAAHATALKKTAMAAEERALNEVTSSEQIVTATQQEIGIIENLKGQIADLKFQISGEANPVMLNKMNAELNRLKLNLSEVEGKGFRNLKRESGELAFGVNRTTQALFALTFLMSSFDTENPTTESAKLKREFMAGAQSALGISFAVQMLGGSLAKFAGPVGIAVGALIAVIGLLNKTDESAKKAAEEGLKDIAEMLKFVSEPRQLNIQMNLEKKLEAVNKLLDQSADKLGRLTSATFSGEDLLTPGVVTKENLDNALKNVAVTEEQEGVLKDIKKEIEQQILKAQVFKRIQEQTKDVFEGQLTQIGSLAEEIKELQEARNTAPDTSILTLNDMIYQKQLEQKELMKNSDDILADTISQEQTRVELGKSTLDNYIKLLTEAKREVIDKDKILGYERDIEAAREKQIALLEHGVQLGVIEVDRVKDALQLRLASVLTEERMLSIKEKLLALAQAETEANNNYFKSLEKAEVSLTLNKTTKRKLEEDQRFKDEVDNIQTIYDAEILNGSGSITDIEEANKHQDNLRTLADQQHTQNILLIDRDAADEIQQLRIKGIQNVEIRMQQQYEFEQQKILQLVTTREITEYEGRLRLRILDIEHEDTLSKMRIESLKTLEDNLSSVGDVLHRVLGNNADDFATKLIGTMQLAVQLARQIAALTALKGAGDSFGGILGIFGTILSFAALNEGGQVQDGSYVVNETQSNRYKDVLDALGAGTVTGGERGKDSVAAVTPAGTLVMMTPGERVLSPGKALLGRAINEGRVRKYDVGGQIGNNLVTQSPAITYNAGNVNQEQVVNAVERLRGELARKELSVNVQVQALHDGIQFLQKYLPIVNEIEKNKKASS